MTAPTDVGLHVPWCDGTHTRAGECVRQVQWRNSCRELDRAVVVAVPCGHAYIGLDDPGLYTIEDVDELIQALTKLRPLLDEGRAEATCTGHLHIDD